jgi:hypothetical protein
MSEENSENQEQTNSGEITITATPENSKKIKNAFADAKITMESNRKLLEERDELKQKVGKYEQLIEDATKEAKEKNVLDRFIDHIPAPVGGSREEGYFTAPLNPTTDDHTLQLENDDSVPLSWQKFDSEADFYQKLSERSHKNDKEAKEIERQLLRKAFAQPFEIEFAGESTKVLYKDYLPLSDNLSEEERKRRLNYNKKLRDAKGNWRVV